MKLNNKISWLMGRVQKSLFPHLNECFDTPLTKQEQRLVSILEIVQVEKYVSNAQRTTGEAVSLLIDNLWLEHSWQKRCIVFPQPVI